MISTSCLVQKPLHCINLSWPAVLSAIYGKFACTNIHSVNITSTCMIHFYLGKRIGVFVHAVNLWDKHTLYNSYGILIPEICYWPTGSSYSIIGYWVIHMYLNYYKSCMCDTYAMSRVPHTLAKVAICYMPIHSLWLLVLGLNSQFLPLFTIQSGLWGQHQSVILERIGYKIL